VGRTPPARIGESTGIAAPAGPSGDSADAGATGAAQGRRMLHALLDAATASPWAYAAILAIAALDAVFPVVPSETTVISAGALAGTGELELALVVACAAAGAAAGDNAGYALGRFFKPLLEPRIAARPRAAARRAWAEAKLNAHAAPLILLARFVPGGRTATTLTAGLVHLPWPRFLRLSVLAGVAWATYVALLGFAGGSTFEDDPLLGIALGLALGLAGTGAISAFLRRRGRRSAQIGDAADASGRARS
jgi:membrane protein DedA with SNARE-associated domain